jgi:hypothetical protein
MPRTTKIDNPPACYEGTLMDWKALSAVHQYRIANTKVNKDKIRAQASAYREANQVKMDAYRKANKDVIDAQNQAYRKSNREVINIRKRAYYHLNRDTMLEQQRNYKIRKAKEFYELFGTYEIEPGIY